MKKSKIKEQFVEKDHNLLQIEKKVGREIVHIGENEPEQLIGKRKKPLHNLSKLQIQKQKPSKIPEIEVSPEIPPELPQLPKLSKTKTIAQNSFKEEVDIEDLEKEIREKKKLLKLKKIEEKKREEERQAEEERKQEEERKALKEEEISKNEISQDVSINEFQEIPLNYSFIGFLKRCPNCNSKLKKSRVKSLGIAIIQQFKCKKCNFEKELSFTI